MTHKKYEPKYPVQTLERALNILYCLKEAPTSEGLTINELDAKLNLGKSRLHRILDTLRAYDFVEKTKDGSSYYLSWGLFELGKTVPVHHTLSYSNYSEELEELCSKFSETVNLGILNNNEVVILCKMEPDRRLRSSVEVGEREPLHSTGLGKLFMTDFTEAQVRAYFETRDIRKTTLNTIIDVETMLEELERIRQKGYAVDNEEYCEDLVCVAMPVRNYENKVSACVSVSFPASRITEQKKINVVRELEKTTARLSSFLGHSDDI